MTSEPEQAGQGAPGTPLDEGLVAFFARDLVAAHACFERAWRRAPREPRPMSWYGVTLVLVERNSSLGVSLCDEAVRLAGPLPELALNLGRAHLALNQRVRAVKAVQKGLELQPDHAGLLAARDALGTRREPVIRFLSRGNPLNRLLGRLRHRWSRRHGPAYELSPVTLGAIPGAAASEART